MTKLDPDFSEFVASFVDNDVRFLIIGGYAMAAHRLPRAAGDLGAWIWISSENAKKVLEALNEFGFSNLGLTIEDFNREDSVVQLGYPPYRIDILTSISGVAFEDAWQNRIIVDLDGIQVPFFGRENPVTNKRATSGPQDIADVTRLTQSHGMPLKY